LNARPLVHGLDVRKDLFSLRFDVPSTCAALLHAGDIDLGMIPSIEYQRGPEPYRIVPDLGIASDGDVVSVALFTRVPIANIRTIGLDTSSRTSVGLTRVLCREAWGIEPRFVPMPPETAARVEGCDAALLIGDPALFLDHASAGLMKVDLGAEWMRMTGLPFVWAVWAGRADALTASHVMALQEARDAGVANSDAIADAYCLIRPTPADGPLRVEAGGVSPKPAHDPLRAKADLCRAYLRDNIQYCFGERETAGLRRYYELAAKHDVIKAARPADFYEIGVSRRV
jgi:chorismate dehydratase